MENEQELLDILAQNIKIRRNNKGWSLEDLAEKTGVSRNSINEIELANNFARPKTLVKLAKALDTEVYELLKPEHIYPDKAADILIKFGEEVKEAIEKAGNRYLVQTSIKNPGKENR